MSSFKSQLVFIVYLIINVFCFNTILGSALQQSQTELRAPIDEDRNEGPVAQYQQQYPPQGYPQQGYPQQGYPQGGYPQQNYPPQTGYPTQQPGSINPHQPVEPQQPIYPPQPIEGRSCVHKTECNAKVTFLTCERGRCICPIRPEVNMVRGDYPLNMIWDQVRNECVSIKDSGCDLLHPKIVNCQAELVCKGKSGKSNEQFGKCVNSGMGRLTYTNLIPILVILLITIFW